MTDYLSKGQIHTRNTSRPDKSRDINDPKLLRMWSSFLKKTLSSDCLAISKSTVILFCLSPMQNKLMPLSETKACKEKYFYVKF